MIAEVDGHKEIILTDMTQVFKHRYIPVLFISVSGLLAPTKILFKRNKKKYKFSIS